MKQEKDSVGGAPVVAAPTPVADSTSIPPEVSVASPLKGFLFSEDPREHLASTQKKLNKSIASPRSSWRRLQLETATMGEKK